uniref:Uncharacterized protein n=1 Tax=Plectus sambesii TaxID=2011161 RepID=A0A914VYE5_9BILA
MPAAVGADRSGSINGLIPYPTALDDPSAPGRIHGHTHTHPPSPPRQRTAITVAILFRRRKNVLNRFARKSARRADWSVKRDDDDYSDDTQSRSPEKWSARQSLRTNVDEAEPAVWSSR